MNAKDWIERVKKILPALSHDDLAALLDAVSDEADKRVKIIKEKEPKP